MPKLSELRTLAGADAYVTNPAEAINKAQRQGINPAGDNCVVCGSPTPVFYQCHAVCESSQMKTVSTDSSILFSLAPGPFGFLFSLWERDEESLPDRQGHDIEVNFLLPVCDPCAKIGGNVTRPGVAKRLMAGVPMYNELIAYYPRLTLKIERPVP